MGFAAKKTPVPGLWRATWSQAMPAAPRARAGRHLPPNVGHRGLGDLGQLVGGEGRQRGRSRRASPCRVRPGPGRRRGELVEEDDGARSERAVEQAVVLLGLRGWRARNATVRRCGGVGGGTTMRLDLSGSKKTGSFGIFGQNIWSGAR
jgi:hypothetical protein